MTRRPSSPRRLVMAALTGGIALTIGLAGCSATNPIATQGAYEPSDGSGTRIGSVRAGNLMVLTSAEGAVGTLLGYVTNEGDEAVSVTIGLTGATDPLGPSAELSGGQTVVLGPDGDLELQLASVPAPPGARLSLTVVSDAGSATVSVPVLDGTLPYYADLVPDAGD